MNIASIRSFCLGLGMAAVGCGTATSVCGCYDNCADTLSCPPAAEVPPCNADPSLGATECGGVYVSASLGDDGNPGTREKPVQTMERAVALAVVGPKHVYACAEEFAEAARLPSGVALWGGLDCTRDWIWLGGDKRTVLAPEPGLVPLRIDPGQGFSTVADLRLEAADAVQPGASSIAMLVQSGAMAEVLRSELVAGDGADGAPGEGGGVQPATAGTPGSDGAAACSADSVEGGPPVATVCGDVTSVGGRGGDGGLATGGNGNDGQPEPIPNPDSWGLGGPGENGIQCDDGERGVNGLDGMHGLGARSDGAHVTPQGWDGNPGQDGGNGLPGQGGGGGGGSRGGSIYCGLGAGTPKGGASGGSGGSGGCGGRGGKGGGYGGASIGLISFSADVSLAATSIVTGKGGDGGAGGLAQLGGVGGAPSIGGASVNGSHAGCDGGRGGAGGSGGYGGGGLGGPSIGIAHFNGQLPKAQDVTITPGEPGKGGSGGNQAVEGSSGDDGNRADTLGFPQ